MKVSELMSELESADPDREVYYIGVGGEWRKVQDVDTDTPHEKLSIVPYEEQNFVGLK